MSDDLANIDKVEIDSLTDQELDSVAGGEVTDAYTCSCSCCVAGATSKDLEEI